jgi:hypothetical protein
MRDNVAPGIQSLSLGVKLRMGLWRPCCTFRSRRIGSWTQKCFDTFDSIDLPPKEISAEKNIPFPGMLYQLIVVSSLSVRREEITKKGSLDLQQKWEQRASDDTTGPILRILNLQPQRQRCIVRLELFSKQDKKNFKTHYIRHE